MSTRPAESDAQGQAYDPSWSGWFYVIAVGTLALLVFGGRDRVPFDHPIVLLLLIPALIGRFALSFAIEPWSPPPTPFAFALRKAGLLTAISMFSYSAIELYRVSDRAGGSGPQEFLAALLAALVYALASGIVGAVLGGIVLHGPTRAHFFALFQSEKSTQA